MPKSEATPPATTGAFSVPLAVSDLPRNRPHDFDISAEQNVLDAAAQELSILGLRKLRFSGTLEAEDNGDFVLNGSLGVTATQACVVSLEPVRTRIECDVTRRFTKVEEITEDEYQMRPEDDENTDPLTDIIDLGAVATETIALNLPDFPRAETASLEQNTFAPPGVTPLSDEDTKPFAGLAALKDKLSSDDG